MKKFLFCFLFLFSLISFGTTINKPTSVIGFFQSYDSPDTWLFNGKDKSGGEASLGASGYTTLIDAFWVNYPFCWGDGSGIAGRGSPIPECKGIKNAPGPAQNCSVDQSWWSNFASNPSGYAPGTPGEIYNTYWTSLHASAPHVIYQLRQLIEQQPNIFNNQKIHLLASIGGWNMGGSSSGQPNVPKLPAKPAWAKCLSESNYFAQAMDDIYNLKINNQRIYDGIDIDMETLYGEGCANGTTCTTADREKAINDFVAAIVKFKSDNPNAILSISPRAADIVCPHDSCPWTNADGIGFAGEALMKLASYNIYFNDINPQFYNDDASRNIPNSIENGNIQIGDQVAFMLTKIKSMNIIGPDTSFNIGVLAQTNNGEVDTGGASTAGNPGVPADLLPKLWTELQTNSAIKASGLKINGIMCWAANLALDSQGIGGNVRSTTSSINSVVPFNWPAGLWGMSHS